MQRKAPLEIASPDTNITASIIWLHGLGADGYDFEPIVHELNLPHIRFILPHAPEMPVSRNNGYVMPAWYDLYGTTGLVKEDEKGIRFTQTYIETLITNEIARGIASNRIMLAGFSQGGAIALQTALRFNQPLAGILALSTYLPLNTTVHEEAHANNRDIPIFLAHGTFDDIIPMATCMQSLSVLKNAGYQVDYREYPMAHSVCQAEIHDIKQFLAVNLPTN